MDTLCHWFLLPALHVYLLKKSHKIWQYAELLSAIFSVCTCTTVAVHVTISITATYASTFIEFILSTNVLALLDERNNMTDLKKRLIYPMQSQFFAEKTVMCSCRWLLASSNSKIVHSILLCKLFILL